MSSPNSTLPAGSVQDLITRFESMSSSLVEPAADGAPEAPLQESPDLVATVLAEFAAQPDYTGELPRGPPTTPRMTAAIPGFHHLLSTPVAPELINAQVQGLITRQRPVIVTSNLSPVESWYNSLTPVGRYLVLTLLDPNGAAPEWLPLYRERQRRHIGIERQRSSASVLAGGIGNDFVPITPVTAPLTAPAATAPAAAYTPAHDEPGPPTDQYRNRRPGWNVWTRRNYDGTPAVALIAPFGGRMVPCQGDDGGMGRGAGRGHGRAVSVDQGTAQGNVPTTDGGRGRRRAQSMASTLLPQTQPAGPAPLTEDGWPALGPKPGP